MTGEERTELRAAIDLARRARLETQRLDPQHPPPAWWAEAAELRSRGLSYPQIARRLCRNHTAVMYACNPDWRQQKIARMRQRRAVERRPVKPLGAVGVDPNLAT